LVAPDGAIVVVTCRKAKLRKWAFGVDLLVNWKAYGGHMTTKEMDLAIGGMTCDHCVHHVTEGLMGLEGVTDASVSLDAKSAHVTLDGTIGPDAIRDAARVAIAEIGYEVVS
jgi:copper chaperone CopZ